MVIKHKVWVSVPTDFKDIRRVKSALLSSLSTFKMPLDSVTLVYEQEHNPVVKQVAQEMGLPCEEYSGYIGDIDALVAFSHHRRVLVGDKSVKYLLTSFRASRKPYRVVEY